jgi:hypothetical protein
MQFCMIFRLSDRMRTHGSAKGLYEICAMTAELKESKGVTVFEPRAVVPGAGKQSEN